ncbi:MAG: hypothetical protein IKJ27_07470 [Clostridia bacterium]|nr:hypothetical protein [Clostridia bacterium]
MYDFSEFCSACDRNSRNENVLSKKNKHIKGIETDFAYDVYEAKYYAAPLSQGEMYKEAEKIRNLKGLTLDKIGFIAITGFEKGDDLFHCITGEELYN